MADKVQSILQSAAVAYRWRKKAVECVLVTSRGTGRWVLPKGMIDSGRDGRITAATEAFEEAGVEGSVASKRIGRYTYKKIELKGGEVCRVEVFPMEVTKVYDEWPERSDRERLWVPVKAAAKLVDEKKLKKLLRRFAHEMEKKAKKAG